MRPGYIALIFWALSVFAVSGIVSALRTGVVRDPFTYRRDRNPVAFPLAVLGKASVIAFAVAETLYAFGLTGNPLDAINSVIPFHR